MSINIVDYRACFDKSPVAFCIIKVLTDDKGAYSDLEFTYMNRAMSDIRGAVFNEQNGAHYYVRFPDANRDRLKFFGDAAYLGKSSTVTVYDEDVRRYLTVQTYCLEQGTCACLTTDVTEHEKQSDEYEKQLMLYRTMEDAGVFRVVADDDFTLLYGNDKYYQIHGYTPESMRKRLGDKCTGYIHPDDLAHVREIIRNAQAQKRSYAYWIMRIITDSGEIRCIRSGGVFNVQDGKIIIEGAVTDITERVNSEKRIEYDNERLRAVVSHAGLYYWEYDIGNRKIICGERITETLGLSESTSHFPGVMTESGFVCPESVDDFINIHRKMQNGATSASKTIKLKTGEGGQWYLVKMTNTFDDDGNPLRAYATAQNVETYRELEEQFNITSEQNGIFVWNLDFRNKVVRQSEAMIENYGRMIKTDNFFDFPRVNTESGRIHPDDAEKYIKTFESMFNGEKSASVKFRILNVKNKKWDWYSSSYNVIRDENGEIIRIISSGKCINKQVETERRYAAFHEQRRMAFTKTVASYRMNLTENTCGFCQSDEPTAFYLQKEGTADGFFESAYKYFSDEIGLSKFKSIFSRERLLQLYSEGKVTPSVEFRFLMYGKEPTWLCSEVVMAENPTTHDIEAIVYIFDIDRHKKMEIATQRLIEEDYEFIGLLDVRTRGVIICGEKNGCRERNADADYDSVLLEEVNKITSEKLRRECLDDLNYDRIIGVLTKSGGFSKTYATATSGFIERKLFRATFLDEEKSIVLVTRADVTEAFDAEQKQREQLHRALADAERANAAKSDFLSRISHDMRTPMNGIIGLIHLSLEKSDRAVLRENLKKMHTSANFLLSLINDSLDMSRIESDRMSLNIVPFDSKNVLESILSSVRPIIDEKNLTLEIHTDRTSLFPVKSDPVRIQQIFSNIMMNAVKFTPRGGRIDASLECILHEGNLIHDKFTVRDTGIGMSDEFLPHLFEPFAQEHSSNDSEYDGTGLGMSIVKRLIELMGGRIEVNSKKGIGTEITVWMTFEQVTTGNPDGEIEEQHERYDLSVLRGRRILLCEDQPLNREITVEILKRVGITTEIAENGRVGVDKFADSREGYYDAVLMDIRMPVMNGYEASAEIRSQKRADAKNIPIIALSANARDEEIKRATESGMTYYLVKPVEPDKLFSTIGSLLGGGERNE